MQKSLTMRGVRSLLGLTQVQLAQKLSITPEYLSMVERGRKPLSAKLKIKVFELVSETQTSKVDQDPNLSAGDFSDCHLESRIAELEAERDYLRDQLAKAQDNLAAALASKPIPRAPAAPAYGVSGGTDKKKRNEA